jgi:invasion protein IalB
MQMSNGGQKFFSAFFAASFILLAADPGAAQSAGVKDSSKLAAQQSAPAAKEQTAPPQIAKTEASQVGNWLLTCVTFTNAATKRACTAKLQILQERTNAVAFVWEIGVTNDRKFMSIMHVPTGILIEPGVELRIGKAAARKIGFNACAQTECTSQFPIDEKQIKEIAANANIEASIVAINGASLTYQINPAGIDKAFGQIAN